MRAFRNLLTPRIMALLVALVAVAVAGCESDDVTGPVQQPVVPPTGNQNASATWNITVTPSTNVVDLNAGATIVQIEVTARRADNNQLVAPGTTALLSTTAGQLTANAGTAASIPIEFDTGGVARASLNTGVPTTVGVIIVRAQIENSIGSTQIQIADVPVEPFQISSVTPSSGPPAGGTPITINGSGFESPVRVSLSVLGSTILVEDAVVASSTRITGRTPSINLPSGQNAAAAVTVENAFDENGPTATDTLAGAFTYTRSSAGPTTLKLISLSPTFGPNEGGTQVSVIGEGFGDSVQVYFTSGPLVEAQILSVTPNRLEVVTPSATGPNAGNANSIVDLRVVDPVSGQTSTLNGAFQYGRGSGGALFISAISPGQDEYLGGTLVTLFGQGFEEPVAVSMGGFGQQIISVTGTEVVVRTVPVSIGCNNTTGGTSLTNIETNESTSGPSFTYVPIRPVVQNVTPGEGSPNGGDDITINGTRGFGVGFDPPLRVIIDGVPLSTSQIVSISGSEVRVTAPEFTGTFPTEPCTDSSGNAGTRTLDARVDVTVINLNTGCSDTLTNGFIYEAPNSGVCQATAVDLMAVLTVTNIGGNQISYSATGSTGLAPLSYEWDFDGSGFVPPDSTLFSGTFDYGGPYDGPVQLRVTDSSSNPPSEASTNVTVP